MKHLAGFSSNRRWHFRFLTVLACVAVAIAGPLLFVRANYVAFKYAGRDASGVYKNFSAKDINMIIVTKSESEYMSASPGERCSFYNAPAFILGDKLFFDRGSMEGLLMRGWDPDLPAVELSDGIMKLHVSHYESHRRETIVVESGRLNLGLHY